MRHRLRSTICIAVVALAGIVSAGAGCSNQGEGERCTFFGSGSASVNGSQPTNGSQDCQDGLVCVSGGLFPTATGTYDRCCPENAQSATVQACMMSGSLGGSNTAGRDASFDDSAADAESTSDGNESDASDDAATTADADAGNDGSADSSSD